MEQKNGWFAFWQKLKMCIRDRIWIEKSKDANGSADFVMEINGAYRSPDFIVGSTDVTAWVEQLRTTTVPWLELRGRHVAFSVQRERLLDKMCIRDRYMVVRYAVHGSWKVEFFR